VFGPGLSLAESITNIRPMWRLSQAAPPASVKYLGLIKKPDLVFWVFSFGSCSSFLNAPGSKIPSGSCGSSGPAQLLDGIVNFWVGRVSSRDRTGVDCAFPLLVIPNAFFIFILRGAKADASPNYSSTKAVLGMASAG